MRRTLTTADIRRHAVNGSMGPKSTLGRAVGILGFVQADPIRAPARAQDLILRHRVADYRAGQLEQRFPRLSLEEDFLYAYGFMPREIAALLHPRHDPSGPDGLHTPTGLAADVLSFVRERRVTHPAELAEQFGKERAVNGWGGFSKATTRALQSLHYHGLLRVARRQDGIRLYAAAQPVAELHAREERTRRLVMLVMRILSPMLERSLAGVFALLGRGAPGLGDWGAAVRALLQSGELESAEVDGERYLWPAGRRIRRGEDGSRQVRLLAPFDPVVWDRRRFEHLWQWAYRFEAYTPPEKRKLGYYAMPLLWGTEVIGWANVTMRDGRVEVATGYAASQPRDPSFRRAFDEEIGQMEAFLAGTT